MREATITFEQVVAVAESIKSEGGKPTSRAVRDRLGSGSMGTVNKMLQDWKAGQERKIDTALALPASLQKAILDFMDMELGNAKAKLMADLVEQQQETADLANENERAVAQMFAAEDDMRKLGKEMAKFDGQFLRIQEDLEEAKRAIAMEQQAAEQARIELAKALLRLEAIPRLEADLVETRAMLEKEHQAKVGAEKAAAVADAQKTGLMELVEELKSVAVREKAQLQKTLDGVQAELMEVKKPVPKPKPAPVKKTPVKKTPVKISGATKT